jgi:hypothetical protein
LLGEAEIFSVKDTSEATITEFPKAPEEGAKVPSSVALQYAIDIFPNDPPGACAISKSKKDEGQVTTRVIQSSSKSCRGKGLAWGAPNEKIDSCSIEYLAGVDLGHIAQVGRLGIVVGQHGRGERAYFRIPGGLPPKGLPGTRGSFYPTANASVYHMLAAVR